MPCFLTGAADLKQCGINQTYLPDSRTASNRHPRHVGVCSGPHFPAHTGETARNTWRLLDCWEKGWMLHDGKHSARPPRVHKSQAHLVPPCAFMNGVNCFTRRRGGKFLGLSGRFPRGSRHGWAAAAAERRWALLNGFRRIWPREESVALAISGPGHPLD